MTTEAAKAAKAKYDARTARYISLKLNMNTDTEMIAFLDQQPNVQGYIKSLILADMEKIQKSVSNPKKAETDFNATLELFKAINKTAHD